MANYPIPIFSPSLGKDPTTGFSLGADVKTLPPDATFLRILGVNYVHLKTGDEGDLYMTEYGLPFVDHLRPENWYEEQWFKQKRERLQGTSTVYRGADQAAGKPSAAIGRSGGQVVARGAGRAAGYVYPEQDDQRGIQHAL